MKTVDDVKVIPFKKIEGEKSFLVAYEQGSGVPFTINRMFLIKSKSNISRGNHAHKECAQLLLVISGSLIVTCDDGEHKKKFHLKDPAQALFIPPTIWAEQTYEQDSILAVLADQSFDEKDYLRNYDEFLTFRSKR